MVTVRNNMDTNVFCIDASKTIKEAIQEMLEKKVWSLVVTKNDLPVGVVTRALPTAITYQSSLFFNSRFSACLLKIKRVLGFIWNFIAW